MKKLFAFILLLTAISAGCIFPTASVFAMSSMDSEMNQGMNHDMSDDMNMPCCEEEDSVEMHKCCKSPFIDSLSIATISYQDDSELDNDLEIIYTQHKNILENSNDRLNSPPELVSKSVDIVKNNYASLVGIIKNNR